MKTIEYRTVDKSAWGDGPWQSEPDKKQWQDATTGLPCLAVRHPSSGHWCGYVGVAPGHPLYRIGYSGIDANAHCGLTFAADCAGGTESEGVCHVPGDGEPDHVWWLGFDCGHAFDLSPGTACRFGSMRDEAYRDLAYVEAQCAKLAHDLHYNAQALRREHDEALK